MVLNSSRGVPLSIVELEKSPFDRVNGPAMKDEEAPNLTDLISSLLLAKPALTREARRETLISSELET